MRRQTFNDINITPLTDIFLVLLILMMVIAPILDQQGLTLAVPEYVEENYCFLRSPTIFSVIERGTSWYLSGSITNVPLPCVCERRSVA